MSYKKLLLIGKKQLLEARLQLSTHKLENTASISKTKKLIAQAKTVNNRKRGTKCLRKKNKE